MTTAEKAKVSTSTSTDPDIIIEDLKLGIWILKISKSGKNLFRTRSWEDIKSVLSICLRVCSDVFTVAPQLSVLVLFCQIWYGVDHALSMYFSNALLRKIEEGALTGTPDIRAILFATAGSFFCSFLGAYLGWHGTNVLGLLKTRVKGHFEMILIKAKVFVDLPTSQEAGSKLEVNASDAWESFMTIIKFFTQVLAVATQIALIVDLSRSTGGPLFAFLCIVKPVADSIFSRDLSNKVWFAYVDNEDHKRMQALRAFIDVDYQQDLISNNLGEWVINEYATTSKRLEDVCDEYPNTLYSQRTLVFDLISSLLGHLPIIFCAFSTLLNPRRFSIASIAILQQSSGTLRHSLKDNFRYGQEFRRSVWSIKKLYESSVITNSMDDGTLSYPLIEEKGDINSNAGKGMSLELRNVSFSYPGSKNKTAALNNTSMSIGSGQLVVIVGANGSGKSTLIRLLSRLYDPTSGQIFIDGHASSDYRLNDLRQAIVILSQDSKLYPFSIAENIGLGYASLSSNKDMVMEAAKEGGAFGFIQKLEKGIDTMLKHHTDLISQNLYGNKTHPLHAELEKLAKNSNISGGEHQRVVAARSFMRFKSGKVKFVAVDEPSSALDAEGELKLFEQLLAAREGKTMIFVTHRFGHLTKHADQIICMKEGEAVEQGTHEQLLKAEGEYAKLYNIQASAFVDAVE